MSREQERDNGRAGSQEPGGEAATEAGRPEPPAGWRSVERRVRAFGLLAATAVLLAVGGGLWLTGWPEAAQWCWAAATVVALVPSVLWVVQALRQGRTGVDAIAVLALAGTLAVGEYLAGALIGLMLATGRTLEAYAEGRAARDLKALVAHAPRTARRRTPTGAIEVVSADQVVAGDRLVVGPGEVVPVDGECEDAVQLDESVLTGESELVERGPGDPVASGVTNAGPAFGLRATATAEQSTYAQVVRLAEQATAISAPTVRLADRYAAWFLPAALAVAGLAWAMSGDPVRAVAVLVVATPCPLLLAAPIAIVSGLSRAARRGVVVRGGGALERLGQARTLLLDKTGTLTAGRPTVVDVVTAPDGDRDQVLRLAAAVEQVSPHVLAAAIVAAAADRGIDVPGVTEVTEQPGIGVSGKVDGRTVQVGRAGEDPPAWARAAHQRAELDGSTVAWVTVDDVVIGLIRLHDSLRVDAPRTIRRLRQAGLARLVMLTGDRRPAAERVARRVGLDEVVARCSPADKVARARQESATAVTVMDGAGVNDAPALAAADVGVAMGAHGATAAAEVADAVMTIDRLDRLGDTVEIARRSRRIAAQSAVVGMGLSLAAMVLAAFGLLPPALGALLQEGIDVLAIGIALRALGGRIGGRPLAPETETMLAHFAAEHEHLWDVLGDLRATADRIAASPSDPAGRPALAALYRRLTEELLPHEDAEERRLYPALAAPLGSGEATVTMSSMHAEIARLVERVGVHLQQWRDGLASEQLPDLLATLYGLEAIARLHFHQEEEQYFSLATPAAQATVQHR